MNEGSAITLVCACGKRVKAPGATPGRVGRCPACGGMLRVPEAEAAEPTPPPSPRRPIIEETPGGYGLMPAVVPPPSTYSAPRRPVPDQPTSIPAGPVGRGGLIACPTATESSVWGSLLYPIWDGAGIALLVFMPPLLGFGSMVVLDGSALFPEGLLGGLMGLLLLLPSVIIVGFLLGFVLLFLERFLVATAEGETVHPAWPMIEFFALLGPLIRWLWAGASGIALGAIPAWIYGALRGVNSPFDRLAVAELFTLGAGFGQMALAASVLHNHVLAANPITVLRAIRRIGRAYLPSCLVTTSVLALLVLVGAGAVQSSNPVATAGLVWLFWVLALYGAMVSLRVLGVCYQRHAGKVGWFGER